MCFEIWYFFQCQQPVAINPDEGKPDLAEADMVIFCGDFNYRLFGITYDEARDFVSQRSFDWLRQKDQLRVEVSIPAVDCFQMRSQVAVDKAYYSVINS